MASETCCLPTSEPLLRRYEPRPIRVHVPEPLIQKLDRKGQASSDLPERAYPHHATSSCTHVKTERASSHTIGFNASPVFGNGPNRWGNGASGAASVGRSCNSSGAVSVQRHAAVAGVRLRLRRVAGFGRARATFRRCQRLVSDGRKTCCFRRS